jgi:hypothetical protein
VNPTSETACYTKWRSEEIPNPRHKEALPEKTVINASVINKVTRVMPLIGHAQPLDDEIPEESAHRTITPNKKAL